MKKYNNIITWTLVGIGILYILFMLVTNTNFEEQQYRFNQFDYERGCMEMLAIEYNFTYPIENKTFEKLMKDKYLQCAERSYN